MRKKVVLKKMLLLVFILSFFVSAQAVSVTAKNYKSYLSGTKKQKLAALDFAKTQKKAKLKEELANLLDNEKDQEVYIKTLVVAGILREKGLTTKIINIYESSTKSEVRFACVLALSSMKDIRAYGAFKRALETETDSHTKLLLELGLESLKGKKK